MTNSQTAPRAWAHDLRPGHVVAFRFPQSDSQVSGKARPCLVIATQASHPWPAVTLAYGTTATTLANRGFDLPLDDSEDWKAAALHEPTRFVLARRIKVRANDPRFDGGLLGDPTIGRIPDRAIFKLMPLIKLLGSAIRDDCHQGEPVQRRRARPQPQSRSTVLRHREISVPSRRSRGERKKDARTIIVEHRRRRTLRPIPSVA